MGGGGGGLGGGERLAGWGGSGVGAWWVRPHWGEGGFFFYVPSNVSLVDHTGYQTSPHLISIEVKGTYILLKVFGCGEVNKSSESFNHIKTCTE